MQLYSPAREDEETVGVGVRRICVLLFANLNAMIGQGQPANK